jgi:Fur family peroxide stress response transcriptional regulator
VDHFDAVVEPHDHFICRSCGQVLDLPLVSMEAADRQAEQLCAGRMEGHELYFYGTCNSCLSK